MSKIYFGWATGLKILATGIFSMISCTIIAQTQVSPTMVASDTSLCMTISRTKGEIFIELTFADNVNFRFIELQRRPTFENNFSRFGYITFDEVAAHCGHIIKKDNYPYHGSVDVLYRVRMVYENGSERIYPSVLLTTDIGAGGG